MQILSLFAVLPLAWHVLGKAWEVYFVAICITPALLACLGQGSECRCCRYSWYSCSLGVNWSRLGKTDFVAICSTPALLACLGQGLECRLRCSRSLGMSWARFGMQILSLFAVLPLSWCVLGKAWEADFVAICGTPALLACLGQGLECRICRNLRRPCSLSMSWAPGS